MSPSADCLIETCKSYREKKKKNDAILTLEEVCYWKIIIDSRSMRYVHIDTYRPREVWYIVEIEVQM